MASVIRYEYSASTHPPEPTESSTLYTGALSYPVGGGFYCAKKWDEGQTVVTRKSFEMEVVEDYIAYYKFDGNTNDETGNFNATNYGATLTTGVKGVANTAYAFIGYNSNRIVCPQPMITSKTYSISLWYKFSSASNFSDNRVILSQYNYQTIQAGRTLLLCNPGTSRVNYYVNGSSNVDLTAQSSLDTNWHHIVITSSEADGKVILYLDNVKISETTTVNTPSSINTIIGNAVWAGSYSWSFDGSIDNVRLYTRKITASEVTEIYNDEKA
jgi:hypothetical protein